MIEQLAPDGLRECPFCNADAIWVLNEIKGWKVECTKRGVTKGCPVNARTHYCTTPEEARALWNTRHPASPWRDEK